MRKSLSGQDSGLPGRYAVTIVGLLALKMKVLRSFDTSVTVYHSTKHNIPEDLNLEQHC